MHTAYCAACASPFSFFSLQASKGAILENSAAGGGGAAGGGPKGLPECGVVWCAVLCCAALRRTLRRIALEKEKENLRQLY